MKLLMFIAMIFATTACSTGDREKIRNVLNDIAVIEILFPDRIYEQTLDLFRDAFETAVEIIERYPDYFSPTELSAFEGSKGVGLAAIERAEAAIEAKDAAAFEAARVTLKATQESLLQLIEAGADRGLDDAARIAL